MQAEQEKFNAILKDHCEKRDLENNRLREQRDQAIAELTERRQKDAIKMESLEEQRRLTQQQIVSILPL